MWRCVSRCITTQVWHQCPCLTLWLSNLSVWTHHPPEFLSWMDILSVWERLGPSRSPVCLCMSSVCPSSAAVLHVLFPLTPPPVLDGPAGGSVSVLCPVCVLSLTAVVSPPAQLLLCIVIFERKVGVLDLILRRVFSSLFPLCLMQVHQSPSMMNLSSVFERKYHTFSRSTTHLMW